MHKNNHKTQFRYKHKKNLFCQSCCFQICLLNLFHLRVPDLLLHVQVFKPGQVQLKTPDSALYSKPSSSLPQLNEVTWGWGHHGGGVGWCLRCSPPVEQGAWGQEEESQRSGHNPRLVNSRSASRSLRPWHSRMKVLSELLSALP